MKKLILSIAVLLALTCTSFAKSPAGINDRVFASFQKEFYKASEVKWAVTNNYAMATFQLDKEVLFAYYDFQGNLVGLVHHMLTSDLPADLRREIKRHYANFWVSSLFQVTNEDGISYFIQLKNADESIVLSSDGTNGWHRYAVRNN
jgi:hypothetical protein